MDYDKEAGKQLDQFKRDTQSVTGNALSEEDLHYRVSLEARNLTFLAVTHLEFLNGQTKTIRRLLWAAVILLSIIAGKLGTG